MNESVSESLNSDLDDISLENFTKILANDSEYEVSPRYTHTFGVRIILLAGKSNILSDNFLGKDFDQKLEVSQVSQVFVVNH